MTTRRGLATLVIAMFGCGPAASPPASTASASAPAGSPTATTPSAPRRCEAIGVDWCNRVYGPELEREEHEVVGGDWELHLYACDGTPWEGEHVTFRFVVRDVAAGDLDGDGADDALVALDEHYFGCGDQGSYSTTHLIVYAVHGSGVVSLGRVVIDRQENASLSIAGGQVQRKHENGCTERWKLAREALAPAGPRCRP